MKSRLSSTIWTLIILNGVALFTVLGLAYSAGRQVGGGEPFEPAGLVLPASFRSDWLLATPKRVPT